MLPGVSQRHFASLREEPKRYSSARPNMTRINSAGQRSSASSPTHARKCAHLTPSRNGKAIYRLNARGSHRREILISEEVRVDVDQTVHHVLNTAAELPFCG